VSHDEGDPFSNVIMTERYSRAPGSGSFDQVVRKGRTYHRARVWIDNAKGVRERRSVYATSEAKLTKKVRDLLAAPTLPRNTKALTVGAFLTERYLPEAKLLVRATTYASYEIAVRVHINPIIGKAKLSTFTADNARAWLQELDAGPRAKQNAFKVLKQGLKFAVKRNAVKGNPLDGEESPKAQPKEARILNLAEVRKLLAAAESTPWFALIFTAVATSMRTSELFGLRFSDIDFERGFVHVQRQVIRTDDGLGFGPLKTTAAKRRIDLPNALVKILKQHKKQQPANQFDLVFPAPGGGFMGKDNWTKRYWLPLLKTAKLPRATFYSLRHAGNSLLAAEGHSIKLLQQRLGHSDPSLSISTYAALGASEGRKGADLLGALLGQRGQLGGQPAPKRSKTATLGK
jgi:integrase